MRSLCLLVGACICLALAAGPVLGQGGADPSAMSAQEKAREAVRLSAQLKAQFAEKKYDEAAETCRRMIDLVPQSPEPHYNLACALARSGKTDDALAALAKAAEMGFSDLATMEKDEDLASLRQDKRYGEALARVKATDAARVEKGADIPGVKTVEGAPDGGLTYRLRMGPAATKEKPNRLLLWLHPAGGSMNSQIEPLSPRFIQRGFALLVLTKKDFRFWSGDDALKLGKTLDEVAKTEGISDDRPLLMGYSAGGQMALELYLGNPEGLGGLVLDAAYPVRILPGGKVAPMELPKGEAARKVPMFVLVGLKDGGSQIWKTVEPDYQKIGIPLTIRYLEGRGHDWLFGADELEALDKWLGDLGAAAPGPAKAAAWRPKFNAGGDVANPPGLVRFAEGQASITVPVERGGHLLFAKVKLNGQEAGWFVVDTGGQMTMLHSKLAADLNLPVTGQAAIHGLGGSRRVALRQVESLALGDLVMGAHRVIDQDLKVLSEPLGLEIGGVLGASLWGQVPFTVDYEAGTITFHDPARFKPPAGASVEKLEVKDGRPVVRATLGGKPDISLAIDTAGTRFLYLAAPFVKQNPELFRAGPVRTVTHAGAVASSRLALTQLRSLAIFGRTFTGVQVQYAAGGAEDSGEQGNGGKLGSPILEHFRLTFDYTNKQLYVEPRPAPPLKERIARGLKVAGKDFLGITPLHLAALEARQGDVDLLLAAKADPNAADNIGRTPLHYGASSGGPQVIRALLGRGADVKLKTQEGKTPLYAAVENDQTEAALALLAAGSDAKLADAKGMPMIVLAALNGNADLAKALVKAGADASAANAEAKTALMAAAQTDSVDLVGALLDAKADPNAQDKQGGTALMFAAFLGRSGMVEALIAAGADVNLKTQAGESALKIAKVRGFKNIVELLEKAGAKE